MSPDLPSAGDFARIVDGRCCGAAAANIGEIVLVTHISGPDYASECTACGDVTYGCVARGADCKADEGYPLVWLRKIPPDRAVLEEIEREAIPA